MSDTTLVTLPSANDSAVALIREAIISKADPIYLRELLAVRRDWEADEARKSYNLAISEFQRQCPIIEKGDKAYDKEYARMDRIWREIRPLLTRLGLSITWQVCELRDTLCHVEGQLRHRDGHGERIVQDIPVPDLLKGQNKAQQMGSASTYAHRYALCSALGIITGDDDDGHAAGTAAISPEQSLAVRDLIEACKATGDFNEPAFWKFTGVTHADQIPLNRLPDVVGMLQRKLKGTGDKK